MYVNKVKRADGSMQLAQIFMTLPGSSIYHTTCTPLADTTRAGIKVAFFWVHTGVQPTTPLVYIVLFLLGEIHHLAVVYSAISFHYVTDILRRTVERQQETCSDCRRWRRWNGTHSIPPKPLLLYDVLMEHNSPALQPSPSIQTSSK